MWGDIDYYATLSVRPSATTEEIKSAYRTLALRFHPDTSGKAHLTQLFRDVHEAYEVLSDPERRKAYDQWRSEKGIAADDGHKILLNVTPSHETLLSLDEPQMFYAILDITAASDSPTSKLPLNLCLVIDRSTSMKANRLQKVKDATWEIIDRLGPEDVFSVVAFSDRAEVVLPSTSDVDKIRAKSVVSSIQASGGTEIMQGLLAGLKQVDRARSTNYANHLVLLTDGQTYGDEEQCLQLADDAGRRNIGISAVGIGSDWNDKLLDELVERSGGSSSYLENPGQINQFFREKVKQLADIFAHQIHLTVRTGQGVSLQGAFRLSPSLNRLQSQGGVFFLGPLGVKSEQSVLLEILIPPRKPGKHRIIQLEVVALMPETFKEKERSEREIVVQFVTGQPGAIEISPRIVSAIGKVVIYKMQERALADIDQGHIEAATKRLETVATKLLNLGEMDLARAALLEAGRLSKTGTLSAAGKKYLKYGTRALSTDLEERSDDTLSSMPLRTSD